MSSITASSIDDQMEEIDSTNIEVVIKSSDGIIYRDTKGITEKGEDIKTTEYFLDVTDQNDDEGEETHYVTVEGECEENQEFVAVEVGNSGSIILHDKNVILWNELCRICANGSDRFIPIFSGEGLEHNLCNKIHTYMPLRISEEDNLPLQVCYNCAATLLAWDEMNKGCLDAQQRLTELQNKFELKDEYYTEPIIEEEGEEEEGENIEAELGTENSNNEEGEVEGKCVNSVETVQIVDVSGSNRDEPSDEKNKSTEQSYVYMCGVCDKLFDSDFSLIRHLKKDHDATMDPRDMNAVQYECHMCGKSYQRKVNLIRHMKCHSSTIPGEEGIVERSKVFVNKMLAFKCKICEHVMTHRRAFLRHIRVHANERPVICHMCGKKYRIENDLKRHIDDVHKKIKRHPCDICGKCFAAKATRDAHRRIHTGEKPFACSICQKKFRSVNLLGIHKRTHTDYRPHKCTYCEKAFRDKQKLTAHEAIHTGNRPYPCDVCGKMFAAKAEAGRHRTVHFSERPFLCSQCGLGFRLNRYLKTHIKIHHKDKAEILLKDLERN